jgi:hypothetical protein
MKNDIGIVIYTKTSDSELAAKWFSSEDNKQVHGTGKVIGNATDGFNGDYTVEYYLHGGELLGAFDLEIRKNGDNYLLFWRVEGKTLFIGAGMEHKNSLCVGWREK